MSFAQRQIDLQINANDTGQTTVLTLSGYKASVVLTHTTHNSTLGVAQIRIYGMSLSDMNKYSSIGGSAVWANKFSVTVSAGESASGNPVVFTGDIVSSTIDFASLPEVSFVISAVIAQSLKMSLATSQAWKGSVSVADAISMLASSIGYQFQNNGVTAQLSNHNTHGSVIDQIQAIANAAAIPVSIEHNKVSIWPNDGTRDATIISINPSNGLVGFPSYWDGGFTIKSMFNSYACTGRQVALTSTLQQANGTFPIVMVTHELSTLTSDGPWFSTMKLSQFLVQGKGIYVTQN